MSDAMDWYNNIKAQMKKSLGKIKPVKEIDQHLLLLKSVGVDAFDDKESCTTYRGKERPEEFCFSERMVNQLMQLAYNQGRKDIEEKSFQLGWDACWNNILKKLDITEAEGE